MLISYNTVCLALAEKVNCHSSHCRSVNSVLTCRASTTLHMSKDRSSCLNTCCIFDSLCKIDRITNTLSIDNDIILFTAFLIFKNVLDQGFLIKSMLFRHQDTLSSVGNTAPQCKISCVTTHNLNDTASLMRCRSITDFIDRIHSCINRCIKSDRIICAGDIQIDRSRNTDRINSEVCKLLSSCK